MAIITPSIEELKRQLAAAEKAVLDEAKAEGDAIPREYLWEVVWHNDYVFTASCRLSQSTLDAVKAYKTKYPRLASPIIDAERINSMNYALIDGKLLSAGGGACVLKDAPDNHGDRYPHPRQLTHKEAVDLRNSIVPDSLKSWRV